MGFSIDSLGVGTALCYDTGFCFNTSRYDVYFENLTDTGTSFIFTTLYNNTLYDNSTDEVLMYCDTTNCTLPNITANRTVYFLTKTATVYVRVFHEDSLYPVNWWKLYMTNSSTFYSGYTTQLTVGKGNPNQAFNNIIDGSLNTSTNNTNVNYTYNFGFTNGTFEITYEVANSTLNNTNMSIDVWNQQNATWERVWNATEIGNTTKVKSSFIVNNSIGKYGDFYTNTSLCNNQYCPMFRLLVENDSVSMVGVYEINLTYPFSYDQDGYATISPTVFQLLYGTSRFRFESPLTGANTNYRTILVNPLTLASSTMDVYLNSFCYSQKFYLVESTQTIFGNPVQIADATVSIYRQFGTDLKLIDQQKTNNLGEASLCVEQGYPYIFTATAPLYSPLTLYDQIFTYTGETVNVKMNSIYASGNYSNPYDPWPYSFLNITPDNTTIYVNTTYTCNMINPYSTSLYSYFTVYYIPLNNSYPPYVSNFTVTNVSNITYPPVYDNTSMPYNYSYNQNATLFYSGTSSSTTGATFSVTLNQTGTYTMTCGMQYYVSSQYVPYGWWIPVFTANVTKYTTNISQTVIYGQNVMAPAGRLLLGYMNSQTLYIIGLVIDMIVSSFFVTKFGARSGFIFLLIWGIIVTILGGWGLNFPSGMFVTGFLLWIFLMVFPYRRSE